MKETPLKTAFYTIEKAIKLYRRMAQSKLNQLENKITIDQIIILWVIDANENIPQVEIAEALFKDMASITRMIELLVKKKYLRRNFHSADRRRYLLSVTKKGKEVLDQSFKIVQKNRAIALKGIDAVEIENLNKTLTKIIKNCQKPNE